MPANLITSASEAPGPLSSQLSGFASRELTQNSNLMNPCGWYGFHAHARLHIRRLCASVHLCICTRACACPCPCACACVYARAWMPGTSKIDRPSRMPTRE
eukprot:scaffold15780_cov68-Phaeocystis_antarctica.AAC.5